MVSIDLFKQARDTIDYAAGETIFEQGSHGDIMYAVVEGEVDIMINGVSFEVVGPGGIVGELALIDHGPRSASVHARVDSRLVPVDERRFIFMVQETPNFALRVMAIMADRLRRMNSFVE